MFLATIFLGALAHSLAAPTPANIPNASILNPICIVAATLTSCNCEPTKYRSIYDIMWSCIGTVLLCTYVSVHHNIPDRKDSWMRSILMKVRTTFYALLAPEFVIMWAMRQRIMAGKIAAANKNRKWTKTHGFFVQMGGLMVEVEKGRSYEIVEWRTEESNFTSGQKECEVNIHRIPTISEAEIQDHGKGDFFAKAVVILQTTWFVIQCIARRYEKLALTELELVTLAFATLNIITYILWWDKPLNVGYPIYFNLDGKRVDGPSDFVNPGRWQMEWFGGIAFSWSPRSQPKSTAPGIWRKVCEEITGGMYDVWDALRRVLWFLTFGPFYYSYKAFAAALSPLRDMIAKESSRGASLDPYYAAGMSEKDDLTAGVFNCVVGAIFGGIHLIGWNFEFPTQTELWLWRSSSLVLTIEPVIFAILGLLGLGGDIGEASSTILLVDVLVFLFAALTTVLYVASRFMIIFLALFSLRSLPNSAYQNVSWSDFIPHI